MESRRNTPPAPSHTAGADMHRGDRICYAYVSPGARSSIFFVMHWSLSPCPRTSKYVFSIETVSRLVKIETGRGCRWTGVRVCALTVVLLISLSPPIEQTWSPASNNNSGTASWAPAWFSSSLPACLSLLLGLQQDLMQLLACQALFYRWPHPPVLPTSLPLLPPPTLSLSVPVSCAAALQRHISILMLIRAVD